MSLVPVFSIHYEGHLKCNKSTVSSAENKNVCVSMFYYNYRFLLTRTDMVIQMNENLRNR